MRVRVDDGLNDHAVLLRLRDIGLWLALRVNDRAHAARRTPHQI